eukprot:3967964-Amphidinium_carterae.5
MPHRAVLAGVKMAGAPSTPWLTVYIYIMPRMMSREAGTSIVSASRRVGGGGVGANGVKLESQHAAASY